MNIDKDCMVMNIDYHSIIFLLLFANILLIFENGFELLNDENCLNFFVTDKGDGCDDTII